MDNLPTQLAAEVAARDAFIKQVNEQIVFRNGRIAMLEELIALAATPAESSETEQASTGHEQPQDSADTPSHL